MLAAVSKTPGGCAGRVCDGAVALLPADTGRVLVVGEMGPTCSVDTALHGTVGQIRVFCPMGLLDVFI